MNIELKMFINKEHLVDVTVTKTPVLPHTSGEWDSNRTTQEVEWGTYRVTPGTLLQLVTQGYNWSHLYSDISHQNNMKKSTFLGSYIVVVDTYNDKTNEELKKAAQQPNFLQPTIAYNHPEKDSVKLLYFFTEKLTPSTFPIVYENVWNKIGISQGSNHRAGSAMIQKNKGNALPSIRWSLSNIIYDINDFYSMEESLF